MQEGLAMSETRTTAQLSQAAISCRDPHGGTPDFGFAYLLNGQEGPRRLGLQEVVTWEPSRGPLWVHLDDSEPAITWLMQQVQTARPDLVGALLHESRRNRIEIVDHDGLIIVFQVMNAAATSPQADRYLRIWLSSARVITVGDRYESIENCAKQIDSGRSPKTTSALLVHLLDDYGKRAELAVLEIDRAAADLENEEDRALLIAPGKPHGVRRRANQLRRFLTPYREALVRLNHIRLEWLREHVGEELRKKAEDAAQVVDDLDSILDRVGAVEDYINDQRAGELNHRMYILTLLSGIMLPLTFLTGLFGVNLGGIPGANNPWAFAIFCGVLVVSGICQFLAFRRLRWWR
jgi:zinc transporter